MAPTNTSDPGFVPTAFLPSMTTYQDSIPVYINVGSMAVMSWDVLDNLKSDYILLFKFPIRAPTIAYFISRLATLGFLLSTTLFSTIITEHCTKIVTVSLWTFPLAIASTTLLFFFRVRALFNRNKPVVAFFGFMWIAVLAGNLTGPWGIVGTKIGSTNYCMITHVEPYVASASIITLVNDTLVFLAITWRLMRHAHVDNSIRTGIRVLAFGEYMPTLSKALLQDGQAYYLTTVTTALMTVIMMYLRAVPAVYHIVLATPNMMLMNMMASRVFRNTKFGRYRQSQQSQQSATSAITFKSTNKGPSRTAPIPLESFQLKNRDDETRETQSTMPIEVKILVESQEEKSLDEKPEYSGPSLGHAEDQK